jgi:hypothetical protein
MVDFGCMIQIRNEVNLSLIIKQKPPIAKTTDGFLRRNNGA